MCENCGMKGYGIEDLENLETASLMFIHYIIGSDVPAKYGQYAFIQSEMDIADGIVMKYQTLFGNGESPERLEFGILYKGDKPIAISRRIITDGISDPDSVGLYRLYPEEISLDSTYKTLGKIGSMSPENARMH